MQHYFQSLNYSMANEDTTLEYELARILKSKKVLAVGGSGSRSLPFLALPIEELTIVDVSADQLLFIELKLQTIKQLDHQEAISFWTSEDQALRATIFSSLSLDSKLQEFYQFHLKNNPKLPPLYWGKWEKTFRTFSKITSLFFSQKLKEGLFFSERPYDFYKDHIKGFKWDTLIRMIGNKAMFNSILYKGNFIKKNSALSYFEYYSQAFERLFNLDIKRSHFLQLCLCGKVVRNEALPIEFDPAIFARIKSSTVKPNYQNGSIFERPESTQYDFVSLSDVPSYLLGEIEKNYLQMISKNTAHQGVVVNRFYLRVTEKTNESGFVDITSEHTGLTSQELVQMYQVQILKKTSEA